MDIGKQIREARKARDWNQAKLSVESGVGIVIVGQIERGEYRKRLDLIEKVAEAVGLDVDIDVRATSSPKEAA